MISVNTEDFKVTGSFSIKQAPTHIELDLSAKKKCRKIEKKSIKLGKLQDKMYANNRYGVLICLQGMDTAGKDSLIREVFKNFNARGVVVHSFKVPTYIERDHDYLWRHYIALPERGKFSVFNRSHYENVLVTRVHPEYLLEENLPGIEKPEDVTEEFWEQRFEQINNFEKHLTQNGTIILKFFLHLSKEEQRQRLLRRLEREDHNWKFSAGDLNERDLWDSYQKYYEAAVIKTSTDKAPWYSIPADDKETSRLLVAKIILNELKKYDFHEPETNQDVLDNIALYKIKLLNEKM